MSYFLTQLANGLSYGLILGLIAVGFVIVFTATGVLNFAHGSIMLAGTYVAAQLVGPVGFWLAVPLAALATVVLGVAINGLLVRNLADATPATAAILMLGVDAVLLTELTHLIGNDVLPLGAPWGADVLRAGAFALPVSRVIGAVLAVGIFGGLWFMFSRTRIGVAMRAAASDGDTAALMGIRLTRTGAVAWGMAGVLATVAGIFLASFPTPGVAPTLALTAFAAIPAWVIGGFDSVIGAIVGGLVVGVTSALATGYEADLSFLGRGFGEVVPYAVMILVLLVRPSGLYGRTEAQRV